MKKTLFTTLALGALMAQAQITTPQLYTPNGTGTFPTSNNIGTTAGNVGIGTSAPTATLEIKNQVGNSATLKFNAQPIPNVQASSSRIDFHSGGYISQNNFPAPGSGAFSFGVTGGTGITIFGSTMDFGPATSQYCLYKGNFNLNGHTWATKVTVGNFLSSCPGSYTFPSDAMLDVMGNAYFRNKIILGMDKKNATDNYPAGYRLYVEDGILTERLKVAVKANSDWSDYVFAKGYALKSLDSVETFIQANKHLPDVPSAQQVVNEGIDVAKMDAKLLQKIEELTLYMIDMNKKMMVQENERRAMEQDLQRIQKQNVELNTKIQQLSK